MNTKTMKKTKLTILTIFFLAFATSNIANAQDLQKYDSLRTVYTEALKYDSALVYAHKSLKLTENNVGKQDLLYANKLYDVFMLYYYLGDYETAVIFCKEYKEIRENVLGKGHQAYAQCCNNLALLYYNLGNYQEAEPLYIEAKIIYRFTLGKKHPEYATSCDNLAQLYFSIGNYQKAGSHFIEAKKIREKALGKEHPKYAISCNNLAQLYCNMGNYQKSEPLNIEAKKIYEKVLGKEHPDYARSCNNLALLYWYMGNYAKAEPLYIEAKNIYEKVLGKEHPDYALSCNNLALLYYNIGHYQKAEQLYIEAKKIWGNVLGKEHPNYSLSCANLAILYDDMGNYAKAEQLYIEANQIMTFLSGESAKFMSEKEREEYLNKKINDNFELYHSFFLKRRKNNKKLVGIVYNNALNIKGQLLRSVTAVRKAILQSGDTALINTYNKMNNIGEILAEQYTLPIAERRSDIIQLEEEVNVLEKKLTRVASNLSGFENLTDLDTKWQNIQKSLKTNESAIEFIQFHYRNDRKLTDSTLYYALVLRKDYEYPKAVFLFEQKQLQKIMQRPRGTSEYNFIKNLYDPKSQKADSLYKLVWQPLENYLKNSNNIYISPAGILNKISFDALPVNTTNILSDKYKIIYTTTTAQAINKTGLFQINIKNTVMFGGIEYDIEPDEMEQNARAFNKKSEQSVNSDYAFNSLENRSLDSLTRNFSWQYLPGSLAEVEEIKDVLKRHNIKVKLYKEKQGSEERFKELEQDAPSILHVSSHGFYFGDDEKSNEYKDMIDRDVKFAHSKNPLLRSGFILSGGNTAFQGGKLPTGVEDGVLTALEISRLNFFKTKLVVLSACQTGLGDVKGSEGVYGLQRSFKMSGVSYLLFSLWEVPDGTTKELMSNFYENWFSGMEIRAAFKKAQNELKTKYAGVPGSAFAWAAFVLMK